MKFSNVDGDGDVDGDQSSQCSQCSQCYSCYSQLRKALNDKVSIRISIILSLPSLTIDTLQ